MPGAPGEPVMITAHGGERISPAWDRGGSSDGGSIDYERLAAALAAQPIRISMSGREVASAVREELLRMGNSLTTLGLT